MYRNRSILGCACAAVLVLAASSQAATPNLQAGLWEYQTTTVIEAAFPIPDQTNTSTECITQEGIDEAELFDLEGVEECEITSREVRSDGMTASMRCQGPDGTAMDMNFEMQFMGERSTGVITSHIESPMGPMNMRIEMSGQRLGDC